MTWAREVGTDRHHSGGPSRAPHSGFDPIRVDVVGAMAEIAVCRYYGENPYYWVDVYDERPGATADLIYAGHTVSVKGRERWASPLDLIVPEHDVANDVYILVSVTLESRCCELRGWIPRQDLLRYEPEPWKWTEDRPGYATPERRRYVPVQNLRPCRK